MHSLRQAVLGNLVGGVARAQQRARQALEARGALPPPSTTMPKPLPLTLPPRGVGRLGPRAPPPGLVRGPLGGAVGAGASGGAEAVGNPMASPPRRLLPGAAAHIGMASAGASSLR